MSRLASPFLLGFVVLSGCQSGLKLDNGNTFACDFTANRSKADQEALCGPGWVCGINNRCQKDEPDVLPVDGSPLQFLPPQTPRVYPIPGQFDAPYTDVAASASDPTEVFAARTNAKSPGVAFIVGDDPVQTLPLPPAEVVDLAYTGTDLAAIVVIKGPGPLLRRELRLFPGAGQTGTPVSYPPGALNVLSDAFALRGSLDREDAGVHLYVQRKALVALRPPNAGEVEPPFGNPSFREFIIDAGTGVNVSVLDARPVPRIQFEPRPVGEGFITPLALTTEGMFYRRRRNAGATADEWISLTAPTEQPIPMKNGLGFEVPPKLRADPSQSIFAIAFAVQGTSDLVHTALSVWRLERGSQSASLRRVFGDCTPCGAGGSIVTVSPLFQNGAIAVDLVCDVPVDEDTRTTRFVRVTGSAGSAVGDACAAASFDPAMDPKEIAPIKTDVTGPDGGTVTTRRYAISDFLGNSLVLGGRHGQLWRGTSFDEMQPLFLDTVPTDISSLYGKPFALTPAYVTAHRAEGLGLINPDRFGSNEDGLLPRSAPSDPASQAAGWVVMSSSDLAKIVPKDGGFSVEYGSALLDAAAKPAKEPYFIEADEIGVNADGSPNRQFIIAAFDSIYASSREVTRKRGELPPLSPVVTPQPGSVIRSFVMDRSSARVSLQADEGRPLAFGYVVTSTALYTLSLDASAGTGAERWIAEQKNIGAGEPLEVFMRSDPDPAGLARVGFRNGQVLSLPSALPLVGDLFDPIVDESIAPDFLTKRAVDFANIAELPVVLTEEGVWVPQARPGVATYQWALKPLPVELREIGADGKVRPKRARLRAAKLHVAREGSEEVLYLFTDFGFVYKIATAPVP